MSTITLTEVRRKLSGIVRSVNEDERKEPVFITVRAGRPHEGRSKLT